MAEMNGTGNRLKEVLEYLFVRVKAERPVTHVVEGQPYAVKADGTLGEPVRDLAPLDAPTLKLRTLTGLVETVKSGIDGFDTKRAALQVVNINHVALVSLEADKYGRRHVWAEATHVQETAFKFNTYCDPEDFLLAFRAAFYFNDDAVKVVQLASTVGSGDSVMVADDGVSQEITLKAGTVTRSSVQLPADGVPLIPWRTFREAAPVESKFLLRMKGVKDRLPQIALFEIDAKWGVDTLKAIADYLRSQLPDIAIIA